MNTDFPLPVGRDDGLSDVGRQLTKVALHHSTAASTPYCPADVVADTAKRVNVSDLMGTPGAARFLKMHDLVNGDHHPPRLAGVFLMKLAAQPGSQAFLMKVIVPTPLMQLANWVEFIG